MNWIIKLWGAVTPDAHLSAFVAVFVVIATAVTAAVFKLAVYIFKRFTKEDTSPSSLGNNNVVLNGSSSNSGTINTEIINYRNPIDSRIIGNLLDQINQFKVTDTEKNTQIKDLHQTIDELTLLSKGQGDIANMAKEALTRLANSHEATDVTLATDLESITENYEKQRVRDDRIAAQLYRGRGALAYANNTHESLGHYQRATQLDPNNIEGWNQLGHLHQRLGELEQAMKDYKKVNDLATEPTHKAIAYGNMGLVFKTQGDLGQAQDSWQRALVLFTELGSPHAKTVQSWLDSLKNSK